MIQRDRCRRSVVPCRDSRTSVRARRLARSASDMDGPRGTRSSGRCSRRRRARPSSVRWMPSRLIQPLSVLVCGYHWASSTSGKCAGRDLVAHRLVVLHECFVGALAGQQLVRHTFAVGQPDDALRSLGPRRVHHFVEAVGKRRPPLVVSGHQHDVVERAISGGDRFHGVGRQAVACHTTGCRVCGTTWRRRRSRIPAARDTRCTFRPRATSSRRSAAPAGVAELLLSSESERQPLLSLPGPASGWRPACRIRTQRPTPRGRPRRHTTASSRHCSPTAFDPSGPMRGARRQTPRQSDDADR